MIKTTAPLVACCFAFVALLILIKLVTKMHRYNPLMYILSFIGTAVIYVAFINVVGLGRYDYVLDGVIYYASMLSGFVTIINSHVIESLRLVLLNITGAIEIARAFTSVATFVYSNNLAPVLIAKIKLTLFISIIKGIYFGATKFIDFAITSFASSLSVHKLHCVYSC